MATALALMLGGSTAADVYRWTDESGKLHFASSLDAVPARYREQASGAAKTGAGNVNIMQGGGQGSAARGPLRTPFSTHAYDPAPVSDDVPDLRQRSARSNEDPPPERRYETKCSARGERCRRDQTQEFKDWKNRQLPAPASSESGD